MINLQAMAVGGVALAAVAFGFGLKLGGDSVRTKCETEKAKIHKAAADLLDAKIAEIKTITVERDQARAEVDKVNRAQAEKTAAAEAATLADQAQRDAAVLRTEAAATQAARETRALNAKLTSSLEAIRNVADECARAPVSPDARKLLDGILAP